VLARATAAPRLLALPEISILGEALLDQVVDARVKGVQTSKLLALELGKRRVDTRNSRRHLRSFEDMTHMSYICAQSTLTPNPDQLFFSGRRNVAPGIVIAACYIDAHGPDRRGG